MRVYTVTDAARTLPATNGFDVVTLTPASNKPVVFLGFTIDNVGVGADAGDAQEELLSVAVIRGFTAVGSGGGTPTPAPINFLDVAAGATAHMGDTTVATTGTSSNLIEIGWNVRVPLREFWPIELCPTCSSAQTTMLVRIAAGGADAITINSTLWFAELL